MNVQPIPAWTLAPELHQRLVNLRLRVDVGLDLIHADALKNLRTLTRSTGQRTRINKKPVETALQEAA